MSPITNLIENRCQELGLTRRDIIRRLDYQNRSKGARRFDEFMNGELGPNSRGLIERLPIALDLLPETITEAVAETKRHNIGRHWMQNGGRSSSLTPSSSPSIESRSVLPWRLSLERTGICG
jgi:hypothetical protein